MRSKSLTKKCTLSTHDAVRELQANMNYVCAVGKKGNPLMMQVDQEGKDYHQLTLQLKEAAVDSGDFSKVKDNGAASGHVCLRVHQYLSELEIGEEEKEAHKHLLFVQKVNGQMREKSMLAGQEIAGTFMINRSQKSIKLVMCMNTPEDHSKALIFLMRRVGLTLYRGKPPRQGLFRALQGTMPETNE